MNVAVKTTLRFVGLFWWYILMPIAVAPFLFHEDLFHSLWHNKSLLFFIVAAFLNAIMDSIESEYIRITIFDRLPEKFWSKRVSCDHAKMIFRYRADAWHICKSLSGICIALTVVFYKPMFGLGLDVALLIGCWIHTFNGFYSHLFKTKDNG